MKIAIGSDHAAYEAKEKVKVFLEAEGFEVTDQGTASTDSCDYPDFAGRVARAVAGGGADRGILICGTGIGMSMAANKVRGIRAALCHNTETARLSRAHNDANVLCMGARVLDPGTMRAILRNGLPPLSMGGRHQRRVDKIHHLEC